MIIKVCGLKDRTNHADVSKLAIDMIGINFYPPSVRYIGECQLEKMEHQKRVGVFVNESLENIKFEKEKHDLDFAQLHGDEDEKCCRAVQSIIPIIKVFRVSENFDWAGLSKFAFADLFLFDTMTEKYGGSGKKFDWEILRNYKMNIPFLISGGIGPQDAEKIRFLDHTMFAGIDINSKFESVPAIKNASLIKEFIKEIRK